MKKILDNKIFKIVFGTIKLVFVLLICSYLFFIIIQNVSGNRSVFGYRMFDIASSSMSGVYEVHDVILVKDFDTSKLKVGDDIVYNGERAGLDGKLVTHRIVAIENNEKDGGRVFTTKGVKNDIEDPAIYDDQVIGKVVGIVPIISPVNHIVKSQLGFFLCVFCPIVIIISLEVFATLTEMKEEKLEIVKEDKKKEDDKVEEQVAEEPAEENSEDDTTEKTVDDTIENDIKEESEEEIEILENDYETTDEEVIELKVDKFRMFDDDDE